ncbi:hypothetical protein RGQ29_030551 [Quercus rubra]|uniref:MAT1 centre domain-containing protein n=1 Tax=Quercus rubra TaxID=3512 RepID=A0AAN7EHT7_QUERU|nr:hypothetical protein RGQ29_030551 [Quercus rubra]
MVVSSSNPHSKEISIRRRIASIFNKREEDFLSLKEYNDYLEEVEDMTFNLIEGIDVPAIEAKIAEYEKENHDQIMINRARKAEELAAAQAASKGPAQNDSDGDGGITQMIRLKILWRNMLWGGFKTSNTIWLVNQINGKAWSWDLEFYRL